MADSPEHSFISQSLHRALSNFSETRLLGLTEASRRTFDYGCVLLRDFSRPLVSQVLWSHDEGIEKDFRTLLFEGGASLKLYFVRDNVRNRARVDEVLRSYRDRKETTGLLLGLRIIPVPDGFDADSENERRFMDSYVLKGISSDLLFGVVFGKLKSSELNIFSDHNGLLGLKYAALYHIDKAGLSHGPSFRELVGSKGSSLREVLTMLTGTGFIASINRTIGKVPTLKGRFLLDLSRRILFEWNYLAGWSDELALLLNHLHVPLPEFGTEIDFRTPQQNVVLELVTSATYAKSQFGVDLLGTVDPSNPRFYSEFEWERFTKPDFYNASSAIWDDLDDLPIFPRNEER